MGSEESNRKMYNITEKLGLRQEIDKLPMEYDTPLGRLTPESVDMSGGQWQRIAMARSLMSDAPVQILDEPTAALDPISESRLYDQPRKNDDFYQPSFRLHKTCGSHFCFKRRENPGRREP